MASSAIDHGSLRRMRGAGPARSLAVLATVAALLANVWAAEHESAVPHVRCAEHAELAHVPAARGPLRARPAEAARAANAAAGDVTGADVTIDRHDHCALLDDSELRGPAPARPAPAPLATPAVAGPRAPRDAPRPAGRQVLAAAPKTSPPRA